jgi:GT2 family glycosyltransferase
MSTRKLPAVIFLPRSDKPRISIIIPTQSLDLVRAALSSIAADAEGDVPFETIVVVNGAGDDLASELKRCTSGVEVVRTNVNRGMTGGYNLGRESASGELIVLMHDDVEVEPGWLRSWVEAADSYPEAGVIGCKVLFPDGRLRGAGNILWRDGTTTPPWLGEAPSPDSFDTPRFVDYSASCSLLVRSETWDAAGGLNDGLFPAYYVDVDMAMSARRLGWSVLYWPWVQVRHRSGDEGSMRWRLFLLARNRRHFVACWEDDLAEQPIFDGNIQGAVRHAAARRADGIRRELPRRSTAVRDDAFYASLDRTVRSAYVQELESQLDAVDAARPALRSAGTGELAYRLGTRVEFKAGGGGASFRSVGGHGPEDWGQWLGDQPFVIELPLADLGSPGPIPDPATIELEMLHYVHDRRSISPVSVVVDGRVVLSVHEQRAGPVTYVVDIGPGGGTWRPRILTIEIWCEHAMSPLQANQSPDPRRLAAGLVAITVS